MGKDLPEEISFGEWVHQRRRLLDLTQQELADQVGCARITLRRIESGALKPSKELALILLDKLGAPQTEREAWLRFARGLSGVPGQPSDFPANKLRTNLPTALTSFIGREKERDEIARLLKSNRLVTLTGIGGIGKTRLSVQTAFSLLSQFLDGTWFVDLAPLSDPALVTQSIAKTLGLIEQAGRPLQTILTDFLQAKNSLLILDNCEHLIQACAALAETLLQSCPKLHILATSREALGIPGEALYLVPSLNTPDPLHPILDTLSQYEAARLFLERALLAQPHFAITNENAPAVAQICHRLDGIPLAIELAAARLRMLSTEQISARLDDRFHLLTGGARTALPRQQTLRAMIDWSYDLLSENEKLLLRRLAVFAGGWSLELAEQVCSSDRINSYEILDMLARLVDKSLIAVVEDKTVTRYHILETVRQYAREKLFESGEDTTIRAIHRDVYLEFVERIEPELSRGQQKKWMDVLEAEHDNLRAALSWSLENEHAEQALRFCSALFNFWNRRGHLIEAAQVCKEALACSRHSESLKTKTWYASVLFASAFFVNATEIKQWSDPSIRALLEQARQIYDAIDAYNSVGAVLTSLYLVRADGDLNGFVWVEKCLSDLCEKVRVVGYPYGMALVKQSMGFWTFFKGNRVFGMALLQESSELFEQVEDMWAVQDLSVFFINQKFLRGELEDAIRLAKRSLLFFQDYGDLIGVASCYLWLGSIAREQGHYETAWHYFTDAVSLSKVTSDRWGQIYIGERIPYLLYLEGKVDEARAEYEAVLMQLKDVPDDGYYGFFHARFAQICLHENRLEEARKELIVGLAVLQKTAPENNIYVAYYGLGELARLEGNYSEAIENYLASLRVLNTSQFYIAFPDTLNGLAKTGLLRTKLEYAARLFGASEALCEKMGVVIALVDRPDYEKHIELLKSKMSAEEFESSWAEGTKMSLEETYEYAMQESE